MQYHAGALNLGISDTREATIYLSRHTSAYFFVGLMGVPVSVSCWIHWHRIVSLVGVSACSYLLVASLAGAALASQGDVEEYRQAIGKPLTSKPTAVELKRSNTQKPLRLSLFFCAGVTGMPLCLLEGLWKHSPLLLVGGGIFTLLLVAMIIQEWRLKSQEIMSPAE